MTQRTFTRLKQKSESRSSKHAKEEEKYDLNTALAEERIELKINHT